MKVGFVGFGEAASSIAIGLHEEGVEQICCFDCMQYDERYAKKIAENCRLCNGVLMETAVDVCKESEIVFSAVPSAYAEIAAEGALPGVHTGNIYIDVSTSTPAEKKRISRKIEKKGAKFVDGAMMGTLLKDRHKVQMLLCGSGADDFKKKMDTYHMNLTVVEGEPGVATSIKFIRSITAKGLSCLLLESLQAAQKFGVEESIVDSFLDSYGPSFEKIIDGYISGAIIHADRREHELQNVVDFLKQEGLPYTMAEATRQKLQWMRDTDIKGSFGGDVPRDWRGVLAGTSVLHIRT